MSDTILVALLALAGTLVGSLGGILTANRLTNWRIEQLEKKVDKYNNLKDRMTCVEKDVGEIREDIREIKEARI